MTTETEIKIFCNNIYQLRKSNHLTQAKMAKLLKIGVSSLRRLERGILPPRMTVDVLFHAYTAFGIPPHQLMAEKDEIV